MNNEKLAKALRDLENRIIQRLAWLREGSLIDIQAFTADIEAILLHLHAAEAAQTMTTSELANRIARGEKWRPAYEAAQVTTCACCGEHKSTPLRIDNMGGYVCLTCIDKRLTSLLDAEVAQARAQNSEWPSIINEAADVLSDVTDMVGEATSKLPSSWRWSLIDDLHGIAGQIAAAPQPQAAEPVAVIESAEDRHGPYLTHANVVLRVWNGYAPKAGDEIYTHPTLSDAERLADALREIKERMEYQQLTPLVAAIIHKCDEALAAHSAQAQPAQDAKDAARYRELRDGDNDLYVAKEGKEGYAPEVFLGPDLDAELDATMTKESRR